MCIELRCLENVRKLGKSKFVTDVAEKSKVRDIIFFLGDAHSVRGVQS